MTDKQKFSYLMCPIRHFKDVIKFVDSDQNLVFAADYKGKISVFYLNE